MREGMSINNAMSASDAGPIGNQTLVLSLTQLPMTGRLLFNPSQRRHGRAMPRMRQRKNARLPRRIMKKPKGTASVLLLLAVSIHSCNLTTDHVRRSRGDKTGTRSQRNRHENGQQQSAWRPRVTFLIFTAASARFIRLPFYFTTGRVLASFIVVVVQYSRGEVETRCTWMAPSTRARRRKKRNRDDDIMGKGRKKDGRHRQIRPSIKEMQISHHRRIVFSLFNLLAMEIKEKKRSSTHQKNAAWVISSFFYHQSYGEIPSTDHQLRQLEDCRPHFPFLD